jgi:isoquinoline 1-oxidoreductase beta subunit
VATLTASGSLLIGALPDTRAAAAGAATALQPNAFVRIDRDGTVTVTLPYVEMGQGAYTSQIMVVAEELEVAPSAIVLEPAPADEKRYGSPLFGGQITGGSGSLRGTWMTMRAAGAAARIMLVQAAARRWQVDAAECSAAEGKVVHAASGRTLGYGELAAAAAEVPVPADPPLKSPGRYKVVGKPLMRVDSPAKVDGSARFGIDVALPGMRYAAVAACPVFNGKVGSVDASGAMRVKGVRQVVTLSDTVAVIGDSTWVAMKGLAALKVVWDEGANAGVSTADLVARADAALGTPGIVFVDEGDVAGAEGRAASRYEAVFRLPALAHGAIEPLNCTVDLRPDRCDVWCGSQVVGRAQQAAAAAAGLAPERVKVHNQFLGGGFGRRLETDYVGQAVAIARKVKGPVKVTWSRAEDLQHDYYRGHNHSRVTVALDAAGKPLSWRHRLAGPNIMARWLPVYQKNGVDLDIVDDARGPYDIPNVHIDFVRHEAPDGMHTGNWRGVGPTRNVFIVESVMDDLARRAGMDPVAYRRALMGKASPRMKHVLDVAVEQSRWGTALPARSGRGIAIFEGFGSYLAIVAQVRVSAAGEIRVERVTCAVDTGIAVNPDIVRAQMEGGVMFGVSAALHERVAVMNGRVLAANYDAYPVLRMNEAPHVDVHIVDSTEAPGGVGEPGTSGTIAAVANAVCTATGVRSYALPLVPADFKVTT